MSEDDLARIEHRARQAGEAELARDVLRLLDERLRLLAEIAAG